MRSISLKTWNESVIKEESNSRKRWIYYTKRRIWYITMKICMNSSLWYLYLFPLKWKTVLSPKNITPLFNIWQTWYESKHLGLFLHIQEVRFGFSMVWWLLCPWFFSQLYLDMKWKIMIMYIETRIYYV